MENSILVQTLRYLSWCGNKSQMGEKEERNRKK
jgi:hypothetical protein